MDAFCRQGALGALCAVRAAYLGLKVKRTDGVGCAREGVDRFEMCVMNDAYRVLCVTRQHRLADMQI